MIYTDNRTSSSTFREWGTSYAPTYLIYVDKQRTAEDAKKLIDDFGLPAHLDEYKSRAFVVSPSNGIATGRPISWHFKTCCARAVPRT